MKERTRLFSKRDFLLAGAAVLSLPLFSACDIYTPKTKEIAREKEAEIVSERGDIFFFDNSYHLVRNGKIYTRSPSEFAEYRMLTKFDQRGRKIIPSSKELFRNYPHGTISQLPLLIDPFTGEPKNNKSHGGEVIILFSGFLSDSGFPYDPIRPNKDTFVRLRDELKLGKWERQDTFFFTYGRKGFEEYSPKDTIRDPRENIEYAVELVGVIKELLPLAQLTLGGNSFGGLLAFEAARRHMDAVNNLFLFSSPIRGLEENICQSIASGILRKELQVRFGIEEKVTEYLFNLWKNKKYQQEVDEFVKEFTSLGRTLRSYTSNGDIIVPKESAYLPGVTSVINDRQLSCFSPADLAQALEQHGKAHQKDDKTIREVVYLIGGNLAAAA